MLKTTHNLHRACNINKIIDRNLVKCLVNECKSACDYNIILVFFLGGGEFFTPLIYLAQSDSRVIEIEFLTG